MNSNTAVLYLREKPTYSQSEIEASLKNNEPLKYKRGKPYAVIMANRTGNVIKVSWAQCREDDVFTKKEAIDRAYNRLRLMLHPEAGEVWFTDKDNKKHHINIVCHSYPTHNIKKALPDFMRRFHRFLNRNNSNV